MSNQQPLDDDPIANLSAEKALVLEEAILRLVKEQKNGIAGLYALALGFAFGLEAKRQVLRGMYTSLAALVDELAKAGVLLPATRPQPDALLTCTACGRGFESAEEYLQMMQDAQGRHYHRLCLALAEKEHHSHDHTND